MQAYRRELRALRRHQRRLRLHRPLTRDGMVLPLLASCLVLALIAGTLLTVFTAGPGGDLPGSTGPIPTASPSRPAGSAPVGPADTLTAVPGTKLPDKSVDINGAPRPLRSLPPAVLALVPANCSCAPAVSQLARQAATAGLRLYLVSAGGGLPAVRQLAAHAPGRPIPAEDASGALYGAYQHPGLTALLAHRDGSVGVAASLPASFRLGRQLSGLVAEGVTPTPTPTASSS